ncbi:MAG: hypothetical protein WD509_03030 [Candidatus Paceibacterota bacterium]
MEELEITKNILVLSGLEGNDEITLNLLQAWLVNYVDLIAMFWWVIWLLVVLLMVLKHVVLPLLRKVR